ncbi:hypothetical protein KRR40_39145 [Niabella defluvii]|nr:hypothetical protein KRR40_39145 [Niabella sp. I65]
MESGCQRQAVQPGLLRGRKAVREQVSGQNGAITITYIDKSGNLIRKAVLASGTPYLVTQYVYDDFGRLRAILSPRASQSGASSGTLSDAVVKNLCFLYFYDAKGRLSKEQKPGEDGFTELVYDRKGRIVMRRSPSESVKGLWELVFYDKRGGPLLRRC